MAFLNTLDNGEYSPPLSIRGGVNFCMQTLGVNPDAVGLNIFKNNNKIHGNFDLSKFECGYFNFERVEPELIDIFAPRHANMYSYDNVFSGVQPCGGNQTESYATNYNRTTGSFMARQAVNGFNNFSSAIVASGQGCKLYIPSSANLLAGPDNFPGDGFNPSVGNITIYGRFKMKQTVNEECLISFKSGNLYDDFITINQYQDNTMVVMGNNNNIRWYMQAATEFGSDYTFIDGALRVSNTSEFYNFILTSTGYVTYLYECYDNNPFYLTRVDATQTKYADWYLPVSLLAGDGQQPVVFSDFGISNRFWDSADIFEFDKTRLFPGLYIQENPYSDLPPPSGSDSTYLNFHFPQNSSGQIGLLNTGAYNDMSFYMPLSSGISQNIYEFDRSSTNATALKVDMWVATSSNNPSGYIAPKVLFTNGAYWSGYPQLIPQNSINLVRFSGQVFDNLNQPSDLSSITPRYLDGALSFNGLTNASTAWLGLGAWYNDYNHSVYSGDINVYSARVYLDAWCIPESTGNALTLYTSGQPIAHDGIDLFLQNSFVYDSTDLYINGYSSEASGCDLYISGGFRFDTTTLYIGGIDYLNDNTTLYIEGSTVKASMPLYIYSQPASEMSGNIPLSIWATDNPTNSKQMSLFIGENAPSGVKTNGMNLYAIGPQSERVTASMNLFLRRDLYSENSSTTLFCRNELTGLEGQVTLFMNAPSGTLGAVPVSGQMNLFIARTEGIEGGLDLSISGPSASEEGIPLSIEGGPPTYSSIPLMTDGIGVNYQTLRVYINGF